MTGTKSFIATFFKSFILGALLTWIISAVSNTAEIWYYFVPIPISILVLLLLYAQSIDKAYARNIIARSPDLFDSVEKEIFQYAASVFVPTFRPMLEPQRIDKASAVGFMTWITIPYCIYAGIKGEWLVVVLTALLILYVLCLLWLCFMFTLAAFYFVVFTAVINKRILTQYLQYFKRVKGIF